MAERIPTMWLISYTSYTTGNISAVVTTAEMKEIALNNYITFAVKIG